LLGEHRIAQSPHPRKVEGFHPVDKKQRKEFRQEDLEPGLETLIVTMHG
jgi:hypothetical protein